MTLPPVDLFYLSETLTQLLLTPSPVGDTECGAALCQDLLCEIEPLSVRTTRKGIVVAKWSGQNRDAPRAVTAHIDTLGVVVKAIKDTGRLQLAKLGNFSWNSLENESVTLKTADGTVFRGLIQISNASHHLYTMGNGNEEVPRTQETMEVRLDAPVSTPDDVRALGIEVGDIISVDPRPEWNEGFIRSRHLDDKALIACMLAATKAICDAGLTPAQDVTLHIANYEEVGHGGATGFGPEVADVVALDIAPVGIGQNSSERACTICVRDANGPYDAGLNRRLRGFAKEHDIALRIDTFPEYCSDGDAIWKAGGDVRVSLIGPGVDGTHSMERTHIDGLEATTKLVIAFLLSE